MADERRPREKPRRSPQLRLEVMALEPSEVQQRIEQGIDRLRGLREGDRAVQDLIACGRAAIGPLRAFLSERDPSGIFLPRCQAVEVLTTLGAREELLDYLAHPPEEPDPVEQAGIDVVTSAVARALMEWPDDELFALLLQTARHKLLPGVVDALAQFGREEALPVLTAALAEDFCRAAAESGFRRLGDKTCAHLWQLARSPVPSVDRETEMSRRPRRSAVRLWGELCPCGEPWDILWPLTQDADDHVAFLACSLCLERVAACDAEQVSRRLVELLQSSDWLLRVEVEDLLAKHFARCGAVVEGALETASGTAAMALRCVIRKASAPNP